ncbi:MAG TPA: YjfB family protein [Rectinemataceae bacterium]|nr:YjfB family protein [Rectinemataceae bacterium]
MDIAAASMTLAQTKVADQVGTAMLSKGLKAAEDQGAELVKMMGSPAPLASGTGQQVDLLA